MMGGIPLVNKVCCFFFTGYYATAAASELLNRNYIRNRIVKSPVVMKSGCSFAVKVDNDDVDLCMYIFDRENVKATGKVVIADDHPLK